MHRFNHGAAARAAPTVHRSEATHAMPFWLGELPSNRGASSSPIGGSTGVYAPKQPAVVEAADASSGFGANPIGMAERVAETDVGRHCQRVGGLPALASMLGNADTMRYDEHPDAVGFRNQLPDSVADYYYNAEDGVYYVAGAWGPFPSWGPHDFTFGPHLLTLHDNDEPYEATVARIEQLGITVPDWFHADHQARLACDAQYGPVAKSTGAKPKAHRRQKSYAAVPPPKAARLFLNQQPARPMEQQTVPIRTEVLNWVNAQPPAPAATTTTFAQIVEAARLKALDAEKRAPIEWNASNVRRPSITFHQQPNHFPVHEHERRRLALLVTKRKVAPQTESARHFAEYLERQRAWSREPSPAPSSSSSSSSSGSCDMLQYNAADVVPIETWRMQRMTADQRRLEAEMEALREQRNTLDEAPAGRTMEKQTYGRYQQTDRFAAEHLNALSSSSGGSNHVTQCERLLDVLPTDTWHMQRIKADRRRVEAEAEALSEQLNAQAAQAIRAMDEQSNAGATANRSTDSDADWEIVEPSYKELRDSVQHQSTDGEEEEDDKNASAEETERSHRQSALLDSVVLPPNDVMSWWELNVTNENVANETNDDDAMTKEAEAPVMVYGVDAFLDEDAQKRALALEFVVSETEANTGMDHASPVQVTDAVHDGKTSAAPVDVGKITDTVAVVEKEPKIAPAEIVTEAAVPVDVNEVIETKPIEVVTADAKPTPRVVRPIVAISRIEYERMLFWNRVTVRDVIGFLWVLLGIYVFYFGLTLVLFNEIGESFTDIHQQLHSLEQHNKRLQETLEKFIEQAKK